MHVKAPQGHDQFRGNRREDVLQEHGRKDGPVTQPRVGLHRRTDPLGQLLHQFANPHAAILVGVIVVHGLATTVDGLPTKKPGLRAGLNSWL